MACPFVERRQADVAGVVSCFERVVLTGSLPDIGHARAMESWLRIHQVRLADRPRWAEPMREETRDNAMKVAAEAGVEIEFIRRLKAFRKEDRVKRVLEERGDAPGLSAHLFGDGELHVVPPLAGSEVRHHDAAPDFGKVPALLLPLHR